MADLEQVIVKRLLAKEDNQARLFGCFHEFCSEIADPTTNMSDIKPAWENLLITIAQLSLVLSKLKISYESVDKQASEFDTLKETIQQQLLQGREEIVRLQAVLETEKTKKVNKEEYNSIRTIISKQPSRKESALEIEKLEKEISDLEEESKAAKEKMQLQSNQFRLVLFGINELCTQFDISPTATNVSKVLPTKKRKLQSANVPSKRRRIDRK